MSFQLRSLSKFRFYAFIAPLYVLAMVQVAGCGESGPFDLAGLNQAEFSIEEGSNEAVTLLAFVNREDVTFDVLDVDVALDRRAAQNIVTHRDGFDGLYGTADDDPFDLIEELDDVPYVGGSALQKLLEFALSEEGADLSEPGFSRDAVILSAVNSPLVGFYVLDVEMGLDRRAAEGIFQYRIGLDGLLGTPDDLFFNSIEELDAIRYVGTRALDKIYDWAVLNGFAEGGFTREAETVFSPRLYPLSHNVRIASEVNSAQRTIDIAIYSFSDQGIYSALESAVERGVQVRAIFETANSDRKKEGDAFEYSRSARLEKMGINVRYVNKIMHHKMMIIDGPQKNVTDAAHSMLITGSGNWSWGAATKYDENTLFLKGYAGLVLAAQREFNYLWKHSRDFVYDASLPFLQASLEITDEQIDDFGLGDAAQIYFTSDNFTVSGDTFRKTSQSVVGDALIKAIEEATESIWIASGHLRLRGVSEALIRRQETNPELDIRVLLDGQEYTSAGYHHYQLQKREECLEEATTETQVRRCNEKGFLFGYQVGQAGVPVRFKYYSYRWHYTYAIQMHHKYMIIDGDELWTGSYNLSDNAERNTFENMYSLKGAPFAHVIDHYEDNFLAIWELNRNNGTLENIENDIMTQDEISLVFTPMSLSWSEVRDLKELILENCPAVAGAPYRTEPENHKVCIRE